LSEGVTEHFKHKGWHIVTHNALYCQKDKSFAILSIKEHYLVLSYPFISTRISFVEQFDSPDYFLLTPHLSSKIS
jgi:hypothetical protein